MLQKYRAYRSSIFVHTAKCKLVSSVAPLIVLSKVVKKYQFQSRQKLIATLCFCQLQKLHAPVSLRQPPALVPTAFQIEYFTAGSCSRTPANTDWSNSPSDLSVWSRQEHLQVTNLIPKKTSSLSTTTKLSLFSNLKPNLSRSSPQVRHLHLLICYLTYLPASKVRLPTLASERGEAGATAAYPPKRPCRALITTVKAVALTKP